MSFEDKTLTCSDCGASFTFSAGEQESFQSRGYTNEPKRCTECREARKAERNGSSGNSYGNRNSGSYSSDRQMYSAVCAECGKSTTVPFEPRQGRPVYCSDSYRKVRVSR